MTKKQWVGVVLLIYGACIMAAPGLWAVALFLHDHLAKFGSLWLTFSATIAVCIGVALRTSRLSKRGVLLFATALMIVLAIPTIVWFLTRMHQ